MSRKVDLFPLSVTRIHRVVVVMDDVKGPVALQLILSRWPFMKGLEICALVHMLVVSNTQHHACSASDRSSGDYCQAYHIRARHQFIGQNLSVPLW